MRAFRFAVGILFLICLVPDPGLLAHSSMDGVILGGYTPEYFAFLITYGIGLAGMIALAALARPGLVNALLRLIRWLRSRPIALIILLYGFWETWHLAYRAALSLFGPDRRVVVVSITLVEIYAAWVLIFAGQLWILPVPVLPLHLWPFTRIQ